MILADSDEYMIHQNDRPSQKIKGQFSVVHCSAQMDPYKVTRIKLGELIEKIDVAKEPTKLANCRLMNINYS